MAQVMQPQPKRMTVRGSRWCSLQATHNLSSISGCAHAAKTASSHGCGHTSYKAIWEMPEAIMSPRWDTVCETLHHFRVAAAWRFWSAARSLTLLSSSICCQTVHSNDSFLCCLVTVHWFQPERLCMSLAKNNLVSLMEWLGLTSCCNKNTLKWLEMYYHSSLSCSLAPCSVIAVMLIRSLHYIHAWL